MTTNSTPPTEPLSFKEYFAQQDDSRYFRDVVRKAEPEVYEWGEAYAAQQTAELTATIAGIAKLCKSAKRMGAGGCDMASMERRQGRSQLAKEVLALLTNLPTAAQAHLDEVEALKADKVELQIQITQMTGEIIEANAYRRDEQAENERLKTELLTLKNGVNGSDKSCCEALADTVADVKLLREALAWYDDKNATEALAQTDKEAYR